MPRPTQPRAAGALCGNATTIATQRTEGARTMTTTEDGGFAAARERVREALAAMGAGNPEPYSALWADSGDVTLFGAWGPIERGPERLRETFHWVGSRFSDGALVPDDTVAFASGDLAYTVGFERGEVSVDGRPRRPMILRVTHVYQRVGGEWYLVHRHADFPPEDQRPGAPDTADTP
jgi:ketosteroid isomerase-like protein